MHRWNFYLCWPPAPGVAFPEHKCGHALLSALSGSGHVLSAGQTTFPSPPPATFLPLPPSSIPGGLVGGGGGTLPDAHGCPSPPVSFTLSSRPSVVSPGTATCWVVFQAPTWCLTGGGTGTRTGGRAEGRPVQRVSVAPAQTEVWFSPSNHSWVPRRTSALCFLD